MLYEFTFPANENTPRLARRALDGQLSSLGPDAESRLRLLISEVVTNAIRHGHLAPDEQVDVKVDLKDGGARVEVSQPTRAEAPVPRQVRDEGGFGLKLVDELTDAWGMEAGPPGVVWFEIAAGGEPSEATR
ncbi:MAG TPA: ATP-binding protein [Actinomycetota bacterium]|nr:ATP-binding protein [Actinomycetota bacterium]